ncbi:hypothetical protein TNCV_3606891 [Trichonephila clavipes]|nr:hypothetical protein TNCV_3606891 [Trichonephila clavipes]
MALGDSLFQINFGVQDETQRVSTSIPVVVDQRTAKFLEELYSHSPPCGAGVDRRVLMSPSVIPCQCFELFGARRSSASILASLLNCSTEHKLLLRDRKILLLKGR